MINLSIRHSLAIFWILFKPIFCFARLWVDTDILRSSTFVISFSILLFLSNSSFRAIEPFFLKIYLLHDYKSYNKIPTNLFTLTFLALFYLEDKSRHRKAAPRNDVLYFNFFPWTLTNYLNMHSYKLIPVYNLIFLL